MIDIITVVFQPELYYLKVQARSIEQYTDSDKIGKIFVVVNDESSVCNLVDKSWWGKNQDKVVVYDRKHFGVNPRVPGWESQQYYKLACANVAESAWSMVLDAKTWFIQPLNFSKVFDSAGRVCMGIHPTIPVFKPAEKFVEEYFKIESKEVIGPAGVPFFFSTNEMHALYQYLEDQGTNMFDFFTTNVLYPVHLTEFMFYSGWIKFKYDTLEYLYSREKPYEVTNVADFQKLEFDQLFSINMQQLNNLTVSLHRKVYSALTDEQLTQWVNFLHSKNLIDDPIETFQLLNTNKC